VIRTWLRRWLGIDASVNVSINVDGKRVGAELAEMIRKTIAAAREPQL
jgi:hypothetical protein